MTLVKQHMFNIWYGLEQSVIRDADSECAKGEHFEHLIRQH